MATTQQPRTDFVKALSRLDATALVVGSMIGSGIFIVSADILRQVHAPGVLLLVWTLSDRKSTRLNSSHSSISYAVFCLKKKNNAVFYVREEIASVDCDVVPVRYHRIGL